MGFDQFLTAVYGMVSWPAIAFAVIVTWLVKRNAFKEDPLLPPAPLVGWRYILKRNLPFVPVLLAILYVIPTKWAGLTWQAVFSQGFVSGAVAGWGYEALRRSIFGEM